MKTEKIKTVCYLEIEHLLNCRNYKHYDPYDCG